MKNKFKYLYPSLFILFSTPLAYAQNNYLTSTPKTDIDRQIALDEVAAIIHSKTELKNYIETNPKSPINKLPPEVLRHFIQSLVFTDKGLGSYNYLDLQNNLSVTDIYQILSLFGAQRSIGSIPNIVAKNDQEDMILSSSQHSNATLRNDQACVIGISHNLYCLFSLGNNCNAYTCQGSAF